MSNSNNDSMIAVAALAVGAYVVYRTTDVLDSATNAVPDPVSAVSDAAGGVADDVESVKDDAADRWNDATDDGILPNPPAPSADDPESTDYTGMGGAVGSAFAHVPGGPIIGTAIGVGADTGEQIASAAGLSDPSLSTSDDSGMSQSGGTPVSNVTDEQIVETTTSDSYSSGGSVEHVSDGEDATEGSPAIKLGDAARRHMANY